MYNIVVAGKTYPGTQASSRSCAMEAGVIPPGVPVPFKREHNNTDAGTPTGTSEDLSVPQSKRHRPSYSHQALEAGEDSPSNPPPWTNNNHNHGAAVFKKSPSSASASASTDQLYQSVPGYEEAGQDGSVEAHQIHPGEHIGQYHAVSFVNPGQHRQSPSQPQPLLSQVYHGIGSHPNAHGLTYHSVGFQGVGHLDLPAKQPCLSSVASNNVHQSHDVTDGLQAVDSQPLMYNRHQHEALNVQVGTETGGLASQRLPQSQQPIQKVYQNPDTTTLSLHHMHGDHGGLGLNTEYQFQGADAHAANVSSGHGSAETTSNGLEAFPSVSYNSQATRATQAFQASSGQQGFFVNQQITGVLPTSSFNLQPYPQSALYSSEQFANQNLALPPSRTAIYPGSIDLGANTSYYQAQYFHFTNPPHQGALMGGGQYYPGGVGSTSTEETAALLGMPSRQQNDPSSEQNGLNVSGRRGPRTSGVPPLAPRSRSNAPSADDRQNGENGNNPDHISLSGMKQDPASIETAAQDIRAYNPRSDDESPTDVGPKGGRKVRKTRSIGPPRRRRLRSQERAEAALTRSWGACLPCHVQKAKCEWVEDDPNACCRRCREISKDSKKAIHASIPCLRQKPQEITLYRSGGLDLTKRWKGVEMKDIGAGDRFPNSNRVINISQGLFEVDHVFKVVEFKARETDKVHRVWTDIVQGKEVQKKKLLKAYCFQSIHDTLASVEAYTVKYAIPAMDSFYRKRQQPIAGFAREPTDLIGRTFLMAIDHYRSLSTTAEDADESTEVCKERILLGNLFILWFAIRHTTGSFWITGTDTLDMEPETKDQSYPLLNKVSAPRMIVAQFDSVNHKILEKYKSKVLNGFLEMVCKSSVKPWLTLYFVMFILLHETSVMCKDRYRHARQNYGTKLRYSIPHFVEALQKGCNDLLSFWHYYNWREWPAATNYDQIWKTHLGYLEAEQRRLIMETRTDPAIEKQLGYWKQVKANNGRAQSIRSNPRNETTTYTGSQIQLAWEEPFYWIAQIFEDKWQAHPTYQREVVPGKK